MTNQNLDLVPTNQNLDPVLSNQNIDPVPNNQILDPVLNNQNLDSVTTNQNRDPVLILQYKGIGVITHLTPERAFCSAMKKMCQFIELTVFFRFIVGSENGVGGGGSLWCCGSFCRIRNLNNAVQLPLVLTFD